MQIIVLHNQSLLDIAIQHTGSVENAFAIAVANGLSVSDVLVAGQTLELPNVPRDTEVYQYYKNRNLQPATAIVYEFTTPELKGIGFMEIGKTFKVS